MNVHCTLHRSRLVMRSSLTLAVSEATVTAWVDEGGRSRFLHVGIRAVLLYRPACYTVHL